MTACDLRKIAARVNLLRAHVELAAVCEREPRHRDALERLRATLAEGERGVVAEADAVGRGVRE